MTSKTMMYFLRARRYSSRTLRELNRVVFSDHPALLAEPEGHGFDHGRKLLRYPSEQVVEYLSPLPSDYTAMISSAPVCSRLS